MLREIIFQAGSGVIDAGREGVAAIYNDLRVFTARTWDEITTPAPAKPESATVTEAKERAQNTQNFINLQNAAQSEPEKARLQLLQREISKIIREYNSEIISLADKRFFLSGKSAYENKLENECEKIKQLRVARTLPALQLKAQLLRLDEMEKCQNLNDEIMKSIENELSITDKIQRRYNAYFKR